MSRQIKAMYQRAGVSAPDGKGIHTVRAHECVIAYRKKGMSTSEAWKRCMGGLGPRLAVKRAHQTMKTRRSANRDGR